MQHLRGRGRRRTTWERPRAIRWTIPIPPRLRPSLLRAEEADAAIVIDGAGLGSTIAANKVPGARAAMCLNETLARYARQHNGANVLALGATLVNKDEAIAIVDTFLDTPMREARYIRRLAKIRDLERYPRS